MKKKILIVGGTGFIGYHLIKLLVSRAVRKDSYVPISCYAHKYHIPKNDKCDCKIWCKYPPDGGTPVVIQQKIYVEDDQYYQQRYG